MSGLEIRCLAAGMEESALDLLRAVAGEETGRFFTPHPFTRDAIVALASHPGKDLYYLLVDGSRSLAYGLLRGWNDGYAIPSLGLAVSPSARRQGYGVLMTHFLHAAARQEDAGYRQREEDEPDECRNSRIPLERVAQLGGGCVTMFGRRHFLSG